MEGKFRTLEIKVLSCEDLRIDRRPVKRNTYVVVRTDPLNSHATRMDTEGGSYPSWDEKLVIEMPMHERFITLEVNCKTSLGNRVVGAAKMPVTDFMGGYLPDNYLNLLSYRLRDPKSERNGIINVSVKIKVPEYLSKKNKKVSENACSTSQTPALAWPTREQNFGGVVTGIPVWCANSGQH